MFEKRFLLALVGLMGASTSAIANVEPDFSYVEAGYTKINLDDTDFSPAGFTVGTSVIFTDTLYGIARFTTTSDDIAGTDIDFTQATIGLGMRFMLSNLTAAYAEIGYENADMEIEEFSESFHDDGYSAAVGLRSNLTESFELDGKVAYIKIGDENDTEFKVTANYYFLPDVAFNASYSMMDDVDSFTIGARYSF
ncbi:outer membrane beta-barrel protein [Alteromonas ponticola]|uniref:Porin family protein n=1 Tax=Alteromonas ponticola TaxID=2720613 RepID=A0ABX1R2Y7_9ALTE|nr:outer membrane beta-barrel protein [Alteromonas ponticola]NMH60444.1 porin family protein [Alteromonas ponticola]